MKTIQDIQSDISAIDDEICQRRESITKTSTAALSKKRAIYKQCILLLDAGYTEAIVIYMLNALNNRIKTMPNYKEWLSLTKDAMGLSESKAKAKYREAYNIKEMQLQVRTLNYLLS